MRHALLSAGFLSTAMFAFAAGCGDSGGTTSGEGGQSSTTSGTTSAGGEAPTTTTTGMGGDATTTTSTGMPNCPSGPGPVDHVVLSEVATSPIASEGLEIWNPTAAAVDLTDYYVSDNSTYVALASGGAWAPITNNAGTDFLARFPAGTSIPADGVLTIGFDVGYEVAHGGCPDFYMGTAPIACGGSMVPVMLPTEAGSITDTSGLSDNREMVIVFTWNGDTGCVLQDVDYVTWGDMFEPGTRVDKTAVAGYQPDTAPATQLNAVDPGPLQSIERCAVDSGETLTGGNGIGGHDETSEDMGTSFVLQTLSTLGTKNACL